MIHATKRFVGLLQADLCKFADTWPFRAGLSQHLFHPRFAPVLLVRLAWLFQALGLGGVAKLWALANQILFGCDVARAACIAGGLYLPHPNGVVIGAHVRIGRNCIVHQGVTLGARGEEHLLAHPIIGDEVELATGAKILGGVSIGDYARIGANAVVLKDVPAYGVAVGIPARLVRQRSELPRSA